MGWSHNGYRGVTIAGTNTAESQTIEVAVARSVRQEPLPGGVIGPNHALLDRPARRQSSHDRHYESFLDFKRG